MERGYVVWLTGLPGSGKSTLAKGLQNLLVKTGEKVEVLDGDDVRTWLTSGLGFSKEDRDTNVRRIGGVARLLARNGIVVIVAAVSPYRDVRAELCNEIGDFVEVYVKCSLDVLKKRDTKGMYAKALRGEIANFTGISDPYEEPIGSQLIIDTDRESEQVSLDTITAKLKELGYVSS